MKTRKRIICVCLTIGIFAALCWAIPFHGLHSEVSYDVDSNDEVTDYGTMQLTGSVEQHFMTDPRKL